MTAFSIEQRARLVSGADTWSTVALPGVPSIVMADGPHGVRRPEDSGGDFGLGASIPATCFPPAAGMASSWNRELIERVGAALGDEARAQGVGVLLGPGINIKRSPLCGRNFEYFSEDPLLSGELGASYVHGLQSRGVGASLKHFAANNQEKNRMTVNAEVDERTLREIYLPAFETVITREQPWTVMCAYNRINGVYASENHWLLTEVLREEWGFEGLVVSDWGAVDDRVAGIRAGLDLEMPGPVAETQAALIEAAHRDPADDRHLADSADRVRRLAQRPRAVAEPFDEDAHHALARTAATESMVLLRNDGILPLVPGEPIAVIGHFARSPRFQGAGSSQVNATRVDAALDAMGQSAPVEFAAGYSITGEDAALHGAALHDEAVELARRAETVLLFVGLPEGAESEGYDREHLELPRVQLRLLADVLAVNARTVVVLTNGSVVSLEPWHDSAAAILETWLLGQAGGSAIADVVFGRVSPSGRLAESIPMRLQDTPSYLNFPGDAGVVRYGEGVFVGYRYYESTQTAVRYPFGHGLSYTSFEYSQFSVRPDGSSASVHVTNTGSVAAREVVQLYVGAPVSPVRRPVRELRAFTTVYLEPGTSATVELALTQRAYSFYDVGRAEWVVQGGEYSVAIGRSAHEMVVESTVTLADSRPIRPLTLESGVTEWLAHPVTGPLFRRAAGANSVEGGASVLEMVGSMPMRRLLRFPGVPIRASQLRVLLVFANNRIVRGIARLLTRNPQ
jgi:beta-glucosidase